MSTEGVNNTEAMTASTVNMNSIDDAEEDRSFRSSPPAAGNETALVEKLPRLATANDVRELVQYLKRRPDGLNLCDVPQPIKKRTFCPPKIAAYESWGLLNRKGDRLSLTPLGWEFARSLEPEARAYRDLLKGSVLYRAALEWIQRERIDLVTKDDLASYWPQEFPWAFANLDDRDIGSAIVSFFHLCQAGELGVMTIGKRGQPGRLRIWRGALLQLINSDSSYRADVA